MTNRVTGEGMQVASKGYADDTASLAASEEGMGRMAEWVNEFCIVNRLSMNHTKSMVFGRDAQGLEMKTGITIIKQGICIPEKKDTKCQVEHADGTTYTRIVVDPISSTAKEIKYLGIYMNMDLNWDLQISKLNSIVGLHKHISIANNLTPEMTTFLFNNYLKPKLEYRFQFMDIPYKQLQTYDKWINKTIADKVEQKLRTNTEAMQLILGVQWPTEYYKITQAVALEKSVNDDTDMGRTTRVRLVAEEGGPNRAKRQRGVANNTGLYLLKNPNYGETLPSTLPAGTAKIKIQIDGEEWDLPEDHTGTWGATLTKRKITVFTDGSKQDDGNGGWSMVVETDWMRQNWRKVHEHNHEQYRLKLVMENTKHWGAHMNGVTSSYEPEMTALVKMLMIIPASWDIRWVTDSQSAIDTLTGARNVNDRLQEKKNQNLISLLRETLKGRTGKVEAVHQHSHKKKYTRESVGNATADLMADVFTLEGGQGRISNTTELPVRLAEKRFYFRDQTTETIMTEAVRQKMKVDQEVRADKRWKGSGCQNRIKNQILEFLPYIAKRKQEKGNNNMLTTLLRTITEVHVQPPKDKERYGEIVVCEYCLLTKGETHERTSEHESRCRHDPTGLEETSRKCAQFATDEADKQGRQEHKQQHWGEEQRDLLGKIQIVKRGTDFLLSTDGKAAYAPTQSTLNDMAERYIRHGEEDDREKQKKKFLEMAIKSINRDDTTSMRGLGPEIWNLVTEITDARVQLHTTVALKAEQMQHYTDHSGTETEFGAIRTEDLRLGSARVAGATTIEGLEDMIRSMSRILRADNRAWTTIITTNTRISRQRLKETGYETIAIAKRQNVSINLKIGELAKLTDKNELLRKLGSLKNAEQRLKTTTFPDNLIKAIVSHEIEEEDWDQVRNMQVKEAIQWMNNPQTLMGVAPAECIKKLMAIGIHESVANKIKTQTEQWMLEKYHEDSKVKAQMCHIENEKLKRQENKLKKLQLKAEKARRQKTRGTTRTTLKKRRREIAERMKNTARLKRQTDDTMEQNAGAGRAEKRRKTENQGRTISKPDNQDLHDRRTRTGKEQEILGRGQRTKKRRRN
jgi:hypothetical protein